MHRLTPDGLQVRIKGKERERERKKKRNVDDAHCDDNAHPLSFSTSLSNLRPKNSFVQGVIDVPIYGRVATLRMMRPPGERKDLLFICTERHKFCLLAFEEATGSLVTRAAGDASDRVGRPADAGQLGAVDPRCRAIALHLYDGLLKIIPCEGSRGELREAFNVRLEEQGVIDIVFLRSSPSSSSSAPSSSASASSSSKPTIALLHEDASGQRHVRTYEINSKERDLADGPWSLSGCDPGATTLAAVPSALGGGALVVGGGSIAYVNAGNSLLTVPSFASTKGFAVMAIAPVDDDGTRWLLGDGGGGLSLLLLAHDGAGKVTALRLERLGNVSLPSCLCYLDNGVVFVGSAGGDSQLVRLSSEPVAVASSTAAAAAAGGARTRGQQQQQRQVEESFVEVLETFSNIGPIVDMAVLDVDRGGAAGALVTASGVGKDGSLRLVRNGIGVAEQASAWDLPGVTRVWGLRGPSSDSSSSSSAASNEDTLLLLSFVGETRLLEVDPEDDSLGEASTAGGLEAREPTLAAAAARGAGTSSSSPPMCLLQVTRSGVRCVSGPARGAVPGSPWSPGGGGGAHVVAAAANDALQALVATSDGRLFLLQGGSDKLSVVSEARAPAQVSCLDISPLTAAGATEEEETRNRDAPAEVALLGSWDVKARLLSLPSLAVIVEEALGGDAVPRSAALAAMESGTGGGGEGGGGVTGKKGAAAAANGGGGAKSPTRPSLSALGAHALMSLGDGRVLAWRLVEGGSAGEKIELAERRSVALGSRAALLAPFRRGGGSGSGAAAASGRTSGNGSSSSAPAPASTAVLAACDRPAVIHCSNRKLVFSNVNAPSAAASGSGGGGGGEGGGGGVGVPSSSSNSSTNSSSNAADVTHFSHFNSAAFPGALAIARARCLSIGTVDSIQRLHVRSIPLGEQPRRLAHQSETGTLAVTVDGGGGGGGFSHSAASAPPDCVRLLDDATFEPLDRFLLERNEVACSIASVELGGGDNGGEKKRSSGGGRGKSKATNNGGGGDVAMTDANQNAAPAASSSSQSDGPFFVVGTALSLPNEPEPTSGRLLVLRVAPSTRTLELVAQRTIRGAAYNVQGFRGMVLAGVNARVSLYGWRRHGRDGGDGEGDEGVAIGNPSLTSTPTLEHVASHSGHILALYTAVRGDFIVVGDLMRSVQVLAWRAHARAIEPVARDYHAAWMTAVATVDDDTSVGAENSYNLFVLKKASAAAAASLSDEERARLETTGEIHVGEFINKFVAGSLVMRAPERGSGGGAGGDGSGGNIDNTNAATPAVASAPPAALASAPPLPSASLSLSSRPQQDTLLFGTIGGVIGVLHPLTKKQFEWFDRLQRAVRRRGVRGVGGFDHAEWRAFANERVSNPSRGIVDGDLVEQFLELSSGDARAVAEEMGPGETAESVAKAVDELSRACH